MNSPLIGIITLDDQVSAPGAPTVALAGAGAGSVDNGAHLVKVTFTTGVGETSAGTASATVTVVNNAADGKVAISNIPVSTSPLVTGRKVYMTKVGGSTYYLLSNGTIADNTSTTLTANDSDATLNASTNPPASNTTTAAKSLYTALVTTLGLTQIPAFAQLILSPIGGTAVLSTNASIAAEADGFPLGDSANFYAIDRQDGVPIVGHYLFSATVNQKVAVYARPIF